MNEQTRTGIPLNKNLETKTIIKTAAVIIGIIIYVYVCYKYPYVFIGSLLLLGVLAIKWLEKQRSKIKIL